MKIAVTGGSGQLGTVLLRRLVADPDIGEVTNLDLQPPRLQAGTLRHVTADVRDPHIDRHLAGCDAVIHLAFIVTQHRPRPEVDAINVDGSRNVFAAAIAAGATQIVYASSVAAYGVLPGHPVPILEDTPRVFQPSFAYAATKFQVEGILDDLEPAHPEVAMARLRPTILLGERMEHPLGSALRHRLFLDSGGPALPVVWDEDVADAFMLALKQRARGAFNLSADGLLDARAAHAAGLHVVRVSRSLLLSGMHLGAALKRIGIGTPGDPAWIEETVPEAQLLVSSERARRELGWTPRCATAAEVIDHFVRVVPEDRQGGAVKRALLRWLSEAQPVQPQDQ